MDGACVVFGVVEDFAGFAGFVVVELVLCDVASGVEFVVGVWASATLDPAAIKSPQIADAKISFRMASLQGTGP